MVDEELELLSAYKDPLIKKFLDHYLDAFYKNPSKKLHVKTLAVTELLIGDMDKLTYLAELNSLGRPLTEDEVNSTKMTLLGNKDIFDQVMKVYTNMKLIQEAIKVGRQISEVEKEQEEVKPVKSKRMPTGVPTA